MERPLKAICLDMQAQWVKKHCPIVDGVVFRDGRVKLLSVNWTRGPTNRMELSVKPAEWTTLDALDRNQQLQWTGVIELCRTEHDNMLLIGGEGGLGSDGFVAAVSLPEAKVIWIVFCNESNPFDVVTVLNDVVRARSTLGTWWCIPLKFPDQLRLEQ